MSHRGEVTSRNYENSFSAGLQGKTWTLTWQNFLEEWLPELSSLLSLIRFSVVAICSQLTPVCLELCISRKTIRSAFFSCRTLTNFRCQIITQFLCSVIHDYPKLDNLGHLPICILNTFGHLNFQIHPFVLCFNYSQQIQDNQVYLVILQPSKDRFPAQKNRHVYTQGIVSLYWQYLNYLVGKKIFRIFSDLFFLS